MKPSADREDGDSPTMTPPDPIGLLLKIMDKYGPERVRGIGNLILLFVVVLVVAASVTLISNIRYAVFGTFIAIFTLPFMRFYGERDRRQRSMEQKVFEWLSMALGAVTVICLVSSAFLNRPVPLQATVFGDLSSKVVEPLPRKMHTISLDVDTLEEPPTWLYPSAEAGDELGRLRSKMGKWVSWCANGASVDNEGKLLQASWSTGFEGFHKFSAMLQMSDLGRQNYVISDGFVFVVDDSEASENVVSFRQYPLNISEDAPLTQTPTCEFKKVLPGEKILILLRVFPLEDNSTGEFDIDMWLEKT